MDKKLEHYLNLEKLFISNGYKLFLVGGTVRDYLLKLPLTDMDAVTNATPEEIRAFLPNADFTFSKYGSVSYKPEKEVKFDITTLREENSYSDSRHPKVIRFVKELDIDVKRRDFTINGLYMDKDFEIIDFVGGVKDLKDKKIRMIGNPDERLKEDPLRIIRAFRFASDFDFELDEELKIAIRNNISELDKLNKEKIKMDINKTSINKKDVLIKYFEEFGIKHLLDVVE